MRDDSDPSSTFARHGLDFVPPPGVTLTHLTPTIGTEVGGLDLRQELDADTVAFLRKLWLARKVIFFRDQPLTHAQHVRLGRCFGELETYPPVEDASGHVPGHTEFLVFERGKPGARGENYWHMDTAMAKRPVAGGLALMRKLPQVGGDTLFADMTAAYDSLSPWLKDSIAPLRAVHRFDTHARLYYPHFSQQIIDAMMAKFPPISLPLALSHPETGRKILYACHIWTPHILGLPRDESDALLRELYARAAMPEHQCRFRWTENAIAFWDNRAVQHYACYDYAGETRRLERVTVLNDGPWPDAREVC